VNDHAWWWNDAAGQTAHALRAAAQAWLGRCRSAAIAGASSHRPVGAPNLLPPRASS